MARVKPILKPTETYTESNFLRLHTAGAGGADSECLVTIEHLYYRAQAAGEARGWHCDTIVDGESMTREDAVFIAHSYASRNGVPVIYECHGE